MTAGVWAADARRSTRTLSTLSKNSSIFWKLAPPSADYAVALGVQNSTAGLSAAAVMQRVAHVTRDADAGSGRWWWLDLRPRFARRFDCDAVISDCGQ